MREGGAVGGWRKGHGMQVHVCTAKPRGGRWTAAHPAGSQPSVHPFLQSLIPGLTLVLGAGPLQHCTSARTEAIGPGCICFILLSRAGLHHTLSVAAQGGERGQLGRGKAHARNGLP